MTLPKMTSFINLIQSAVQGETVSKILLSMFYFLGMLKYDWQLKMTYKIYNRIFSLFRCCEMISKSERINLWVTSTVGHSIYKKRWFILFFSANRKYRLFLALFTLLRMKARGHVHFVTKNLYSWANIWLFSLNTPRNDQLQCNCCFQWWFAAEVVHLFIFVCLDYST